MPRILGGKITSIHDSQVIRVNGITSVDGQSDSSPSACQNELVSGVPTKCLNGHLKPTLENRSPLKNSHVENMRPRCMGVQQQACSSDMVSSSPFPYSDCHVVLTCCMRVREVKLGGETLHRVLIICNLSPHSMRN